MEGDCRDIAKKWTNSYVMAIFGCCREIFDVRKHKGGFGGEYEQAVQYFKKKAESFELQKRESNNQAAEFTRL